MRYHKQEMLVVKGSNIVKGSCYPTVLACLLDLDLIQVPLFNLLYWTKEERENFMEVFEIKYLEGKDRKDCSENELANYDSTISITLNLWDIVMKDWLASQGYIEKFVKSENVESWVSNNKGIPYMVFGKSSRGVDHVVIYQDGILLHDPHPSNEGLVKIKDMYPVSYLEKVNKKTST